MTVQAHEEFVFAVVIVGGKQASDPWRWVVRCTSASLSNLYRGHRENRQSLVTTETKAVMGSDFITIKNYIFLS